MAGLMDLFTLGLTDDQKRQALMAAQMTAQSLQRTPQALMDMFSEQLPAGFDLMAKHDLSKSDMDKAMGMAYDAMFAAPAGITAWHGSPYKFGAFDPTKIGSGEGAQAYGYGHYLAESPGVAKEYRNALSEPELFINGRQIKTSSGSNMDTAKAWLQDSFEIGAKNPYADAIEKVSNSLLDDKKSVIDALKKLKASNVQIQRGGFEYKIDLPDEHVAKMLNWDQELGQQTPEIMKLAKQHGLAMDDLGGDLVAAMNAKRPAGAEAMRQAGVPGIKYFDAQSRGGKMANTQNFVVFPGNEGLLKMLEMNDKPMSFWGF